jgi:ribonuclease P protein component
LIRKGIAPRFTLGKQERLKSRKLIAELFDSGKHINAHPLKAIYKLKENELPLQGAFSVSSKNFRRAVDRNRIKRLMREAYRIQKNELKEKLSEKEKQLIVFFIFTGREIPDIETVNTKMTTILNLMLKDVSKQ